MDDEDNLGPEERSNKQEPQFKVRSWSRRDIHAVYNWVVIFATIVVCNIPLCMCAQAQRDGHPVGWFSYLLTYPNVTTSSTLDEATLKRLIADDNTYTVQHPAYILIAALNMGIVIPSAIDLCVDVFEEFGKKGNHMDPSSSRIVRMSMLERAMFLFGVFCNGFYLLFPYDSWNVMILQNIDNVYNNLPTTLQIAPVLLFLERHTNAFTPLLTSCLVTTLGASTSTYVLASLYSPSFHPTYFRNGYIALYGISTFGIVLASSWCFFDNIRHHAWFKRLLCIELDNEDDDDEDDVRHLSAYENFNTNFVPACHMIMMVTECLVCFVWYFLLSNMSQSEIYLLNVLFILTAAIVMAVEMRVRSNLVRHGLDLLESKRSFVRFVSHEVSAGHQTHS